jgi:hypothetical protein
MSEDAPKELQEAIDGIDAADDVVDLLVELLKICRRHASKLVKAGQTGEGREAAAAIELRAAAAFTSKGLSDTTKGLAKEILTREPNLALAARALALGIDHGVRTRDSKAFVKLCAKRQGARVLEEDDPYPTTSYKLASMYGGSGFSRRPRRTTATGFDRVDGLALWPADAEQPLEVIYDTDAGALLDSAMGERDTVSILAVMPNKDFGEFQAQSSQHGLFRQGSQYGFFPMQVTDTKTQDAIIDRALWDASARDIDIVVTPELSCTPKSVAMIRATLAKIGTGRPRVVIAGGSHIVAERRNRMTTIYADPNSPVYEHDKIGEYVFSAGGYDFTEDIERSTELRIHAGVNWSMIPVICADLLDDAVVDAVADLCPRLVIVPCMSSKIGDFEMSAGAVIRKSQALVVVVNGPPDWPAPQAPPGAPPNKDQPDKTRVPVVVIGMPLATSWITTLSPPTWPPAPYAVVFRSGQRTAQFVLLAEHS